MANTKFDFADNAVLVTGGTRGIGRAISEAFLAAGARVISTYVSNDAAAESFKQGNAAHEGRLDLRKCDVASYEQVEALFKALTQAYPDGLQILVNNSGIRRDSVLGMMKPQDWQDVIGTNLSGTFNMSKFAVQWMMQKRYGRIINITSPCSHFGFAGQANYAASKAGQIGLTRSLSKEVATRGITVNCVSPGFVGTELLKDLPEKQRQAYVDQVPMRRFGNPEEIAACVLFLASKEAAYVTGTVLEVTGGL
ncbi:MAG TPA: 3-oxoacyl-ACP reductase FabG [Planctomycetota bacterium]|jgi:3-oxoacyl-[acyl-carrier protein] reductase